MPDNFIAFRVPECLVEWQFFEYPLHSGQSRVQAWGGCDARCLACLAARRDHDPGDEDRQR